MQPTKKCFRCNQMLSIDDFYKHPQTKDGYLNKCKECTKKDVKTDRASKARQYSEYEKTRNKSIHRKIQMKKAAIKRREQHPEKYKAVTAVNNAIRDGKLVKGPCIYCGDPKAQGHHDDYSKPLEVRWVCFKCHREKEHGQTVVQLQGERV